MATVFVSDSHVDKKIVDAVASGLERRGLRVWIDSNGLRSDPALRPDDTPRRRARCRACHCVNGARHPDDETRL